MIIGNGTKDGVADVGDGIVNEDETNIWQVSIDALVAFCYVILFDRS